MPEFDNFTKLEVPRNYQFKATLDAEYYDGYMELKEHCDILRYVNTLSDNAVRYELVKFIAERNELKLLIEKLTSTNSH